MRSRVARGVWCLACCVRGCPCYPYILGEQGYIEGVLVGYGVGILVGYNCTSSVQGRSDSIPIPIEAS